MKTSFSRRKMLLAGSATVIAPFVLSGGRRAVADVGRMAVSDHAVSATPGSDPGFGVSLDTLYPRLADDPTFKQIAPLALLVTHQQGPPVLGFSVSWKITTKTGTNEIPLYFYISLGSPAAGHIQSALGSARRNILQIGQSRLVTPFFSWTPDYYLANSPPNWDAVLRPPYPGTFLVSELQTATEVTILLDAVIFADWKMMGPNKHHLGTKIRARRNAEHDVGLSVYRLIKQGASDSEISQTLQTHGWGLMSTETDLKARWYEDSRRFHAQVLLKAFQNTDRTTFTRALTRLTRQRKTLITRAGT